MTAPVPASRRPAPLTAAARALSLPLALGLAALPAAAQGGPSAPPRPDPRVGRKAGLADAGEAAWNLRDVSKTPTPDKFSSNANTDLAFTGRYVLQGNYNGFQVWDLADPARPALVKAYYCPASQSDVSVYKNLLFVSSEAPSGRLDCGDQGVKDPVSKDRLRGIRVFDITDIRNPRNVGNVQTCRGSHTHTVLEDPKDKENVYVYISGSAGIRSPNELPGCVSDTPDKNPNSALFRIEVIKVPVANPSRAAIVSSPRIFNNLTAPPRHGEAPEDIAAAKTAAAATSSGASPCRAGATRPVKIRGELTIAACSGRASGTLMTSIRNSAELGSFSGLASTHPGSSFGDRTPAEPEM